MIEKFLFFLLTVGVLITVHEYGHYRVARACGVRVLRFSIGFGTPIWRRQRDAESTEFVVGALPLGGYVRMLDEREGPVAPAEQARAFNRRPLWQRMAVVVAGPLANLGLAVLLFAAAQWHGVEEAVAVLATPPAASLMAEAGLQAGDRVTGAAIVAGGEEAAASEATAWQNVRSMGDLRWVATQAVLDHRALQLRVVSAGARGTHEVLLPIDRVDAREPDALALQRIGLVGPLSRAVIRDPVPGGPAARAGLQSGDEVVRVDGQAVPDAAWLFEKVRANGRTAAPEPMQWEVRRGDQLVDLVVQPRQMQDRDQRFGRIDSGISAPPETVLVRDDIPEALRIGAQRTWENATLTLRMLGRMLVGEASLKNLSGPLTIASVGAQSAHEGLSYYLAFLALVSVSLGVLNLLPLPVLDGGHLLYYLFEGATGRPVSDLWQAWLQRGGIVILLLLMSLALSNDVVRLLGR